MKIILSIMILLSFLNANIEVKQNIRALYKGVNLSDKQKEYLIDNHDENIKILKESLEKEVKKLKVKYLDEKNVVSFELKTDEKIGKIRFLKRSDNNKLDKATKKAIKNITKKLIKTNEDMIHRFIILYRIGHKKKQNNNKSIKPMPSNREYNFEEITMPIYKGTTRFQYNRNEYVRTFTTNKDGFINLSMTPYNCANIRLLTNKNQRIQTGVMPWSFNIEAPQGKYKLLIKVKKTCDVSLQYL